MILKLLGLSLKKNKIGKPPTRARQKVVLTEENDYAPCENAPKEGSSYECGGIVCSIRKYDVAQVDWANGRRHSYSVNHLRVISDGEYKALLTSGFVADNPNVTFKQQKAVNDSPWANLNAKDIGQYPGQRGWRGS